MAPQSALGKALARIKIPDSIQSAMQGMKDAKAWFKQKLSNILQGKKDDEVEDYGLETSYRGMKSNVKDPFGRMSYFIYQAEHDKKLPYWDMTPLSILYDEDAEHFYGLNLHYVHPMIRASILRSLVNHMMNANSEKAFLRISYNIIKTLSTNKYIKPCIKTYLKSNFRTPPVVIKPDYWHKAIMLPTANWVRASNSRVWTKSSQMF